MICSESALDAEIKFIAEDFANTVFLLNAVVQAIITSGICEFKKN